ncbi:chorismate mutase [bacterium]|nr:chorismate mutase [bacterium]
MRRPERFMVSVAEPSRRVVQVKNTKNVMENKNNKLPTEIIKIREQINAADRQIINALALRANLIKKISKYKNIRQIRDIKREVEIIENVSLWAEKKGLNVKLIQKLYTGMLFENRKLIRNILKKS